MFNVEAMETIDNTRQRIFMLKWYMFRMYSMFNQAIAWFNVHKQYVVYAVLQYLVHYLVLYHLYPYKVQGMQDAGPPPVNNRVTGVAQ